jgi:hypothetical protein
VATNLDKSLDQEGIFNRLTNNGEAQGVYIIDGQVYVNMSYARSGTLVLGGLNNTNGLLKVLDANSNEIGHWGNDGIVLNKGSININNGAFQVSNSGILNATGATINGILYTVGVDHFDFPIALYMGHGSMRYYMPNQDPRRDSFAYIEAFSLDSTSLDRGTLSIVGQYGVYIGSDGQPGYPDPLVMIGGELEAQGDVKILNSKSLYITNGNATIQGNLTVNGTKSRSVVTDQYADRLLYCYETPSPLFGDVGEGKIGDDGKCYIWIDPVFAQTITTTQYQVFLQRYGNGECWVSERKGIYFVVEGTPGMAFGWELKAKQRDFDQKRLEPNDDPFTVPNQTYGEDAARHIDELKKERIPV